MAIGWRLPALPALALAGVALVGCGNNTDSAPARLQPSLLAQRVVAAEQIPNLYRCLGDLGAALRKDPGHARANLACATGTYRGLTASGRHCELQVDGLAGVFHFELEGDTVDIRMENVAYEANGRSLHNLTDASGPDQPGIQLTRFTGAPVPVTEALILRFGARLPSLPQMLYQRSAGGRPETVLCNFGK